MKMKKMMIRLLKYYEGRNSNERYIEKCSFNSQNRENISFYFIFNIISAP